MPLSVGTADTSSKKSLVSGCRKWYHHLSPNRQTMSTGETATMELARSIMEQQTGGRNTLDTLRSLRGTSCKRPTNMLATMGVEVTNTVSFGIQRRSVTLQAMSQWITTV